jgi:hypothetical protein
VSRPTAEIAQVYSTLVRRCRQPRGQVQCLIQLRPRDDGLLTHVAKDRDLGPRGDQRLGDTIDPYSGAPAVTTLFTGDPLEREDAVRSRERAEAQRHHAGVRCHATILAPSADTGVALSGKLGASADDHRIADVARVAADHLHLDAVEGIGLEVCAEL